MCRILRRLGPSPSSCMAGVILLQRAVASSRASDVRHLGDAATALWRRQWARPEAHSRWENARKPPQTYAEPDFPADDPRWPSRAPSAVSIGPWTATSPLEPLTAGLVAKDRQEAGPSADRRSSEARTAVSYVVTRPWAATSLDRTARGRSTSRSPCEPDQPLAEHPSEGRRPEDDRTASTRSARRQPRPAARTSKACSRHRSARQGAQAYGSRAPWPTRLGRRRSRSRRSPSPPFEGAVGTEQLHPAVKIAHAVRLSWPMQCHSDAPDGSRGAERAPPSPVAVGDRYAAVLPEGGVRGDPDAPGDSACARLYSALSTSRDGTRSTTSGI